MSRHLVPPIRGPLALPDLRRTLQEAHDYLADAARRTAPRLADARVSRWGVETKRQQVRLSTPRPSGVSVHVDDHSFVEVVNQCATLERLLDAAAWAEHNLEGFLVRICNPTTSSSTEADDHDLVLADPSGNVAKFEVCDVTSAKDGNRKELKDLCSLGVLDPDGADVSCWPTARVFLVVSPEFAVRMRKSNRHGLKRGVFHYREHVTPVGDTRVFEVARGLQGEG